MSRGPGRIERAIEAVFDTERDNAFTLEELCERVYADANQIERKHHISVARAARNLERRRPEFQHYYGENLGNPLVFFRHDEVMSYAMARLKADRSSGYQSNDWRRQPDNNRDEADLRSWLGDGGSHRALVEPGGAWWTQVRIFLAERAGDLATVARLKAFSRPNLSASSRRFGKPHPRVRRSANRAY
jgi:hypothetical protein